MAHHVQGRGKFNLLWLNRVKFAKVVASELVQFLVLFHVLNLHQVFTDAMNARAVQSTLLELGFSHAFDSAPYLNLVYFFGMLPMSLCRLLIRGLRLADASIVRIAAAVLRRRAARVPLASQQAEARDISLSYRIDTIVVDLCLREVLGYLFFQDR